MNPQDQVYRTLQRHLDKQAIGFPATRSGAEIELLKHIFTPREAEIATCLRYRFEPVETLFERAGRCVGSIEELQDILDGIKRKGGIEVKLKDGAPHYCCLPLVVGMYELQNERLTPDFLRAFKTYSSTKAFGIDYLSTALPQMRTIPISTSISHAPEVSNFDHIHKLLSEAEGPFAITECICRKKRTLEGRSCKVTRRRETCLGVGHLAQMSLSNGFAREISKDEAISIIEQNQKDGLILQPSNSVKAEFICSCCGCCCGILSVHKHLPKPLKFWATNHYAVVDAEACVACRLCETACQVDAINIDERKQQAAVNLDRCLGCGICVVNCPTDCLELAKKVEETVPPPTREALNDIIMEKKKGAFGKILLTGNLVIDTLQAKRKP